MKALALFLLLSYVPDDSEDDFLQQPEVVRACEESGVIQALHDEAVERGLIDPDEWPSAAEDGAGAVRFYRCRMRELKDTPALAEATRFGRSSEAIHSWLAFNRQFRERCGAQAQLSAYEAPRWYSALEEARELYQAWDMLDDALIESASVYERRLRLKALRDRIGEAAWNAGRMPPPVPLSLFRQVG
jgi:hypothetical protein